MIFTHNFTHDIEDCDRLRQYITLLPTSIFFELVTQRRTENPNPYRHASISCPGELSDVITTKEKKKMTAPDFNLIPPESKVIPLPTNARGCSSFWVDPW